MSDCTRGRERERKRWGNGTSLAFRCTMVYKRLTRSKLSAKLPTNIDAFYRGHAACESRDILATLITTFKIANIAIQWESTAELLVQGLKWIPPVFNSISFSPFSFLYGQSFVPSLSLGLTGLQSCLDISVSMIDNLGSCIDLQCGNRTAVVKPCHQQNSQLQQPPDSSGHVTGSRQRNNTEY